MYMLSGCKLIDTENISSLANKLHILSSRLLFFSINHIHIQMTFIILKSNINTVMIIFFYIKSELLVYEIMTNDLIYYPILFYVFHNYICILILKYFSWACWHLLHCF